MDKVINETPPLYNDFISKYQFDKKFDKQILLGIKGMFFKDKACKEYGAEMLYPKYVFPTPASPEAELYIALMEEQETQGIFCKFLSEMFIDCYYKDIKQMILIFKKSSVSYNEMMKDLINKDYIKYINIIKKEIDKYDKSLIITPLELEKLEKGFEVILGKKLSEFDHKKYKYLHYIYNEGIYIDFINYLHPEGINNLKNEDIPFKISWDAYYSKPLFYDFNNSIIDIENIMDFFDNKISRELESFTVEYNENFYIKGKNLGMMIQKYNLDLRKIENLEYLSIIALIKTSGTLKDALLSTLTHINRDYLEYGNEIEVSKEGKKILKTLKGKIKKAFNVMFVTEECARSTGYCYFDKENNGFDILMENKNNSVIASWGMTESVYDFIIIREKIF